MANWSKRSSRAISSWILRVVTLRTDGNHVIGLPLHSGFIADVVQNMQKCQPLIFGESPQVSHAYELIDGTFPGSCLCSKNRIGIIGFFDFENDVMLNASCIFEVGDKGFPRTN